MKIGRLCIITDTYIQNKFSHLELCKLAIKGGADMVQFRDKTLSTSELIDTAIEMRKLCNKSKVQFIVNDRGDVALLSKADGIHLGKEDMPIKYARKLLGKNKIIGGTAHNLSEAIKAEKDGADYIGFGHIYPTSSKNKTTKPKGLAYLKKIIDRINIPVLAIGGINLSNINEVLRTGVHGVAVIGEVVKSVNPQLKVKSFKKYFV